MKVLGSIEGQLSPLHSILPKTFIYSTNRQKTHSYVENPRRRTLWSSNSFVDCKYNENSNYFKTVTEIKLKLFVLIDRLGSHHHSISMSE